LFHQIQVPALIDYVLSINFYLNIKQEIKINQVLAYLKQYNLLYHGLIIKYLFLHKIDNIFFWFFLNDIIQNQIKLNFCWKYE
jgi:hypothetical protein